MGLNVNYELVQSLEGVPVATVYKGVSCGISNILDACLQQKQLILTTQSIAVPIVYHFVFRNNPWHLAYDDEDAPAHLSGKIMLVYDHTSVAIQG